MMTLNAEAIATRNVSGGFKTRYYRIIQTSAYIVAVLVLYFLVQHYHQQIYNLEEYPLSYQ